MSTEAEAAGRTAKHYQPSGQKKYVPYLAEDETSS